MTIHDMIPHRLPVDPRGMQASGPRSWRAIVSAPFNLAISLVCLLAIAGIWWVTLQRVAFEREQAMEAAMQSNANLAFAFEQQVFRTLKSAEQVAAFVREQYLRQGPKIDLTEWIKQGVIREKMFTIISIVDERGEIVRSSQATGRINYADREFFQIQRESNGDKLFISQPVLGRVSGRWQLPMSLRISRPDGSFAGVVVMSIDPANFTDFYRQAELGPYGLLELSGLDGWVRGRMLGSERSFGMTAQGLPWFERRRTVPEGEFVDESGAGDGVARIVSYRTMGGYPLMVAVGTGYADELAPALQRRNSYFLVAGGATAALLVFAGLLMLVVARRQASEALFRATFHQAAAGIAHIAPDGRILGANEKFCRMLGYSRDELLTHTMFDLSEPDQRAQAQQFLADRLSDRWALLPPEIEKSYRRKDGTIVWVCEALGVVKDLHGKVDFLVAVAQDITVRKDLEARLSHDALHDALTGLPNRVMFQDRLARALESARRRGGQTAVLYLDLDGFKNVNDQLGHAVGDALLQRVAWRLEGCVRSEDTIARIGGDEFGIVLAALSQAQDCEAVAQKILSVLSTPFELEGQTLSISASVGAALFPDHGDDTASLLAHADSAMYAAKHAGKNRFYWEPWPDVQRSAGTAR